MYGTPSRVWSTHSCLTDFSVLPGISEFHCRETLRSPM